MALYDGFFDAVQDEDTGEYDRAYNSPDDFTNYFAQIIGSGVCVHDNPGSFLVRLEGGQTVVSPGYLFIRGYWLKNNADYVIELPDTGTYAIVAHLNLGKRMIELEARSVAQAYPDSLVLAIVSPASAEDTRHNTDICGVIETAGDLSGKVEWALNYIDSEIESKLAQVEQDIAAQERKLNAKIAEVQAVADSIVPPPIGSIKFSASQDVGEEWLQCDGSFVNESQYPELVAALGKLIPSGDKFQLISSGEIGPQITNGALYGGRLWVYSYSAQKLYGVDVEGSGAVKEIALTSEEEHFGDFLAPTTERPLCLSIVPHKSGAGAEIFLTQVVKDTDKIWTSAAGQDNMVGWDNYFLVFGGEFAGGETSVSLSAPFSSIKRKSAYDGIAFSSRLSVPYVVSHMEQGSEIYRCVCGATSPASIYTLQWARGGETADTYTNGTGSGVAFQSQRYAYSQKNKNELILIRGSGGGSTGNIGVRVEVKSYPDELFSTATYYDVSGSSSGLTTPLPISVGGTSKILASFNKEQFPWIEYKNIYIRNSSFAGAPPSARTFADAAAYLWGKDIYMIFVGTGIIFSRTLKSGDFGYLDTTSVLGVITQFGYLDYAQNEGTLYLLGQDTTNTVKVAKIVLNTLYDYADDGAWLPMIAADGVPAYIKVKEAE